MLLSMGVGRRKLVPFWVLALALACSQHTGKTQCPAFSGHLERPFHFLKPWTQVVVKFRVLSGSWQAISVCESVLLCSPCLQPDNFRLKRQGSNSDMQGFEAGHPMCGEQRRLSRSPPNWPGQTLSLLICSQPFLAKPWAAGVLGTEGSPSNRWRHQETRLKVQVSPNFAQTLLCSNESWSFTHH